MSGALSATADGVSLAVHVQPGAPTTALSGLFGGKVKLRVREVPEGGRANRAVLDLVADVLGVNRREVGLVAGQRGRDKRVVVRGISLAEAESRLRAALIGAAGAPSAPAELSGTRPPRRSR